MFPHDSVDLLYAVGSILLKAHASPVQHRTCLQSHTDQYIAVSRDGWMWRSRDPLQELSVLYPDAASAEYTLLLRFRNDTSSASGINTCTQWLACNTEGALVILKFPARRSWSAAVVESATWLHLYGVQVRVVDLLGSSALELPVVYIFCLSNAKDQPDVSAAKAGAKKGRRRHKRSKQTVQQEHKRKLCFEGVIGADPQNIPSMAQSLEQQLLALAVDPLTTARRALEKLVSKDFVLQDADTLWGNIAILPQRGVDGVLQLTPIILQVGRLQSLQGPREDALQRMLNLLEAQLMD